MKSSIPEYLIALLACVIMAFAVSSLADTVYFDNGESIEVPAGELYRSSEPLYGVTGDLSSGVTVTPAEPLIAPSEPVVDPEPDTETCYQGTWAVECDTPTDSSPEFEVDCEAPRPPFDGTFGSVWAGKAWDAACED